MTNKPENPPAFPLLESTDEYGGRNYDKQEGMPLRDYFASHAPISLGDAIREFENENVTWERILKRLAQMRFAYADAMLKERLK